MPEDNSKLIDYVKKYESFTCVFYMEKSVNLFSSTLSVLSIQQKRKFVRVKLLYIVCAIMLLDKKYLMFHRH